MWINSLLFVAGCFSCLQLINLPSPWWLCLLPLAGFFYLVARPYQHLRRLMAYCVFFLMGFAWTAGHGYGHISEQLPAKLVKQDLLIEGVVGGLPQSKGDSWRFAFYPDKALHENQAISLPDKIRLAWYQTDVQLQSGDRWRFSVRLKPPVGLLNEGLFDYEQWLFINGFGATGYVTRFTQQRISGPAGFSSRLDRLRQNISGRFDRYQNANGIALVKALSVGDKSAFSPELWQVFRDTGINHLVAISGLHISIIALLV